MVATFILLIFLRINDYTGGSQLLVRPTALWPTQPKFWVVVAQPAHAAAPCRTAHVYSYY